jgi:hypothetical protein
MLPILFMAMATYVGWVILQGFRRGVMEPIGRGLNLSAERKTHPRWFWAALLWNALLVGLCVWGAVGSAIDR